MASLTTARLERPDAGAKAGEFFTPPEVVDILVRILQPRPGDTIYDPTCGSGGMLIHSADYLRETGHDALAARYRGHPKCGVGTKMPEEIIRSYLVNPFLYGGGPSCCGCGEHVPEEELFWTETGQNMAEYNRELQEGYLRKQGQPPPPPEGVGQG